ncbi:MAG TPA: Xaa-Pro aminopeptidase, partial [Flavisolibacter sp.]|nr:Xaa-Pro aminopeptidase [Flavisolibacter sp.]
SSSLNMFAEQRQRLVKEMLPGSVAILTSNDVYPTNADGNLRFFQNTNLYYLTGIKQEETMLVLCPDHPDENLREVLLIKEVNELFIKWNGCRLTKEEAATVSAVQTVLYVKEFEGLLKRIVPICRNIYLHTDEHPRSVKETETREDRLVKQLKALYPLHQYERLYPLLALQRNVKTPAEIALLKKAAAITEAGFRRVLRFVKPGVNEKQVEAEMIHEYMQHGSTWADYEPIVAAGVDTCILHYHGNKKVCKEGDLLLIDAAASWEYYNADLTRTIPVSGRYTPRQKQCYNAVLNVHRQMKSHIKAGMLLKDLQAICFELLLQALITLDLCTVNDIQEKGKKFYLDKYCYHNFSHFIGLDVHDIGYHHLPIPAGAVLTNEPGIYIQEEAIGIRIENNLLVTEAGVVDLMANIPIEADEIEALMQAK